MKVLSDSELIHYIKSNRRGTIDDEVVERLEYYRNQMTEIRGCIRPIINNAPQILEYATFPINRDGGE